MKKIYLALLAVALAFPIQTQATDYKVESFKQVWKAETGVPTGGRQATFSGGKVYTVVPGVAIYYTSGTSWSSFTPNGVSKLGIPICHDDQGRILYQHNESTGAANTTFGGVTGQAITIGVIEKGTATYLNSFNIPVNTYDGRSDFMSAAGDVYGGNGYMYFMTNASLDVQRVKRSGTTLSRDKVIASGLTSAASTNFPKVTPGSPDEVLVIPGNGTNHKLVDLSAGTSTAVPYKAGYLSGTKLTRSADKTFYIFSSCEMSGSNIVKTQFSVYNASTGIVYTMPTPIHTTSYTPVYGGNHLWVDAEFVDDNTIHVYCYQMNKGAWKYEVKIAATLDIPDTPVLTGEVPNLLDNSANLKWAACANATSYTVERSDDLKTWTEVATGVTGTTYTDINFKDGVNAMRHYRVTAYNQTVASAASEVISLYTPWVPTLKLYNFDGYAKVEVEWETTKGTLSQDPRRPSSFDLYRNGVLYRSGMSVTHNVDFNLPVGNYEYYVVSKYNTVPTFYTGDGTFEATSNIVSAQVGERLIGNILYGLDELYNYPIANQATSAFGDANNTVGAMKYAYNQDQWRQGKLWKENDGSYWWYISNRDNSSNKTPGAGTNPTDYSMVGGVFRIKADAGGAQAMANSAQRMITCKAYASVGMAMDEKGNIFVRERDNFPIDMTVESGSKFVAGDPSDVAFREFFTNGIVFKRYYKADGTPYYKDYSYGTYRKGKWDAADKFYPAYSGSNGGTLNTDYKIIPFNVGVMKDVMNNEPVDYYAATGDLFDGTGSVYFANHRTNYGFKADVTNGAVSNVMTTEAVTGDATGTESFFFPILPNQKDAQGNLLRDDYILQIRSNSYGNVGADGKKKHAIYTSNSRVNNAGGTTAYFNGEMFLITPEAINSKNTGDFYIAKAVAADGGKISKPADAVFSAETTVPIATWEQKDNLAEVAENANAMWFGCVPYDGKDENGNVVYNTLGAYMDIYLYVPGTRFAKYRLRPYIDVLNPNTDIDVYIAYDDQDNPTDIKRLDAKAAWTNVEYPGTDMELKLYNIDITVDGQEEPVMSFHVKPATVIKDDEGNVVGHEHVVCDDNGNVINNSGIVIETEWRDASGNIVDKNTDGATEWCFVTMKDVDENKNYVIKVSSVFGNTGGTVISNRRESDVAIDNDQTTYQPVDPTGNVYIDQEGYPFQKPDVWTPFPDGPKDNGEDGSWTYKWHVNYRVDINFDKVYGYEGPVQDPIPTDRNEPVSHYEIWYIPNDAAQEEGQPATPKRIEEFTLLSTDGNEQITDGKIPGTYNFDKKTTAIPEGEGNNAKPSVISFYVQPEAALNSDGTPAVDADGKGSAADSADIPDGTYIIRAVWAADNDKITKIGQGETMAETIWGTTGVWNELVNLSAKDYITPNVTSDVTVAHATGSIESIVIYNIGGGVVAQLEGNKDCVQQVNVSNLASGVYFVSINGGKAHRLIKK